MSFFLALPSFPASQVSGTLESNDITIFNEKKARTKNELLAYPNAALSDTDDEVNYTVSLQNYGDQIETDATPLNLAENEENVTTYEYKYIKTLDLMVIDSSKGETYYGFPYVSEDGKVDVQYDFDGISTTSSGMRPGKSGRYFS